MPSSIEDVERDLAAIVQIYNMLSAAYRWFSKKTSTAAARRQLDISTGICIIVSVIALAPLTFSAVAEGFEHTYNAPQLLVDAVVISIYGGMIYRARYYFSKEELSRKNRHKHSVLFWVALPLAAATLDGAGFSNSALQRFLIIIIGLTAVGFVLAAYLANLRPLPDQVHDSNPPQ